MPLRDLQLMVWCHVGQCTSGSALKHGIQVCIGTRGNEMSALLYTLVFWLVLWINFHQEFIMNSCFRGTN